MKLTDEQIAEIVSTLKDMEQRCKRESEDASLRAECYWRTRNVIELAIHKNSPKTNGVNT